MQNADPAPARFAAALRAAASDPLTCEGAPSDAAFVCKPADAKPEAGWPGVRMQVQGWTLKLTDEIKASRQ